MATINLPYVRFVRQVSNGAARSKYSFLAMMRENAAALVNAPWKEAKAETPALTVNQLTRTDGIVDEESGAYTQPPTFTAYLDDSYDAFTQAGDAVSRMATLCGYAGIAAYRFTLPTTNPGAINSFRLRIQRDRYLRSGVRVAAALSNDPAPSALWSVIRGEGTGAIVSPSETPDIPDGVESFGFLGQPSAGWLLEGRPEEAEIEFSAADFPSLADAASFAYLYIYISPEDFSGAWTWYSDKDPRAYYIEGSAMLVPSGASFTFATDAVAPAISRTFELVRGGVVPSFAASTSLSPVLQCTAQRNGDPLAYNTIKQIAATVAGNGGSVNGVSMAMAGGPLQNFSVIFGYGFKGSWNDLPGLVIYDIGNRELRYFNADIGIAAAYAQLLADGVYGIWDVKVTGRLIAPLLYQIGHTAPTPVLDGVACYFETRNLIHYLKCIRLNHDNGVITGGTPAGSDFEFNPAYIRCVGCSANSWLRSCVADGSSLRFAAEGNSYPSVPYSGTILGMVECDNDAAGGDPVTAKCLFVWGNLTSIGESTCRRCAFVTFTATSYTVTVPEIDSDANWPDLGERWSVTPQRNALSGTTSLDADYSQFLVCGCAEGGPRRFVTGVWYKTAYDENLIGGRELPQAGVIGYTAGYGGFFPATISTEDASIPLTDAAAGLRSVFGLFRSGALSAVPNVTAQPGAGFCVSWKECQLKSSGVKIGAWQIACAALTVPFGCPEWGAKAIAFDWSGWTGMHTAGAKFHVWIARGRYTVSPAELLDWRIWGKGSISGLEYVGEIDPADATSASLALSRPLTESVATLIVTASVSMDDVNPSTSPVLPIGASTLAVNMADATVENADTAFMPDITLTN